MRMATTLKQNAKRNANSNVLKDPVTIFGSVVRHKKKKKEAEEEKGEVVEAHEVSEHHLRYQ